MNMNDFIEVLQEKKVPYSVDGDKIFVDGNLDFCNTSITSLPDNLSVLGWLDLRGTSITSLPDNLRVSGDLDLRGISIGSLPDNLIVCGWLDLSGTSITSLPDNLRVNGSLYLRYASITSLPDNLSVGGDLGLSGSDITRLPENLSVCGSLDFCHTDISSLPDNLEVYGSIYLHPNRITNIVYREFWKYDHYTVFAAWLNGTYCVVINDKIYTFEWFDSESVIADVAQAARECVAELTQRWKGAGCSTTWINVFDCLPELDTPVFGDWFSDNGDFFWGCYVRTRFANATDWVWATAEDFGDGHWLFDDDYPIKFWMPLPGKPELVGVRHEL